MTNTSRSRETELKEPLTYESACNFGVKCHIEGITEGYAKALEDVTIIINKLPVKTCSGSNRFPVLVLEELKSSLEKLK